jgi:hypothetical protein
MSKVLLPRFLSRRVVSLFQPSWADWLQLSLRSFHQLCKITKRLRVHMQEGFIQ